MYNVLPMNRKTGFLIALGACVLISGCKRTSQEGGPEVSRIGQVKLLNDEDTLIRITGKNLARVKKVLLWAGTPERLKRQVSVYGLEVMSDHSLNFIVRAGILPGTYMVVLQTEEQTTFSQDQITVDERAGSVRPGILRVEGQLYADVPSRIYLVGPGLGELTAVELAGPRGKTRLKHLRAYSAARVGVSLAPDLIKPGRYGLRLARRTDWTDGPDIQVINSDYFLDGLGCFVTYFLVLGGVFIIGLFLAYKQGDVGMATAAQRRNLVMLMSGFVFTFVMLGSVQFFLAWWR